MVTNGRHVIEAVIFMPQAGAPPTSFAEGEGPQRGDVLIRFEPAVWNRSTPRGRRDGSLSPRLFSPAWRWSLPAGR